RSRHASTWMRRIPAEAARSPILAADSAGSCTASLTGRVPPQMQGAASAVVVPTGPGSGRRIGRMLGSLAPAHQRAGAARTTRREMLVTTIDRDLDRALDGVEGWFS